MWAIAGIIVMLWGMVAQACVPPEAGHMAQHLDAVNSARAQAGVPSLVLDERLSAQAQAHACDMGRRGYFSHTSPEGEGMMHRLARAALGGMCRGAENIAKGQRDIASAMRSWMGSQGHRRNLLDPRLTHVGFGLGDGRHWVQLFAGRC